MKAQVQRRGLCCAPGVLIGYRRHPAKLLQHICQVSVPHLDWWQNLVNDSQSPAVISYNNTCTGRSA